MTDKTGIYAIENLRLPRVYVGATKSSFDRRRDAHFVNLRQGYHFNCELRQDVRRLGVDAFRFVVLQELPRFVEFSPFEQFWIDYLTSIGVQCYNVMRAYEKVLYEKDASGVPHEYCYTIADVMSRMKIAELTIYIRIRDGVIQPIRRRTRWHFSEENILQLMRHSTQTRLRVHEEAVQRWRCKRENEQLEKGATHDRRLA